MKKVLIFLLILPFFWTGCDTTSKLGTDEVLYTGVKRMHIRPEEEGAKITSNAESAVRDALSVKPNNALYSPYVRWPFPFGLWVYNHVEPKKDRGFKHWFYDRFSKKPVLLSTVQPDLRVAVIPDILANYGYFLSSADYSLIYNRKNSQKSRITYDVSYGKPWRYTSIDFPQPLTPLTAIIDSAKTKTLLHVGDIYQSEVLSSERTRIASALRNRGYYFFRPDYLYYLADTTFASHEVALRLQMRSNIPMEALQTYRVGHITFDLKSASGKGAVDSVELSHVKFVYQKPLKVRKHYIDRNITLKEGELYTLDHQNESLKSFLRMGIFRYVNLSVSPSDSTIGNDLLDLTFNAAMDSPMEAWFETDVTSATNSFIGPEIIFGVAHKNIFGGGERLSIELSGSYEWQTGKRQSTTTKSSLVNSYEFGIKASLVFPRLLPSSLLWNSRIERRYGGKTTLEIGADLMNRPQYFRMLSLNASFALDFQTSSVSSHTVQLPRIGYNYLINTTAAFDSTLQKNRAIALSFRDQLIPVLGYTYRFNQEFGREKRNHILWQTSFSTAGNLLSCIVSGNAGDKKILGIPFSQFAKATTDFRYYRRFWRSTWIATRFQTGVGWAYGNSTVLPYSEQFYIGGASSIRAFTIRTVGPGRYTPPEGTTDAYLDQTGSFKLEANIELRFPILGNLQGAAFLDAGNIWLLKADESRPGGTLDLRNFGRDIALGTGVGIRYDITFLILRFDMGIGLHVPSDNDHSHYYNMESFGKSLAFHLAIGYPF